MLIPSHKRDVAKIVTYFHNFKKEKKSVLEHLNRHKEKIETSLLDYYYTVETSINSFTVLQADRFL